MNRTFVVIADAGLARLYDIEQSQSSRRGTRLVERAVLRNEVDLKSRGRSVTGRARTETNTDRGSGPAHAMGEQRKRHRVEIERRFGLEIARRTGEMTRGWKAGTVVLVAEPRFLGLAGDSLRRALGRQIEMMEIARDYTGLAPDDLHDHLARNGLVPARRH